MTAVLCAALLGSAALASPASACTKVGGVRVGSCPDSTAKRKAQKRATPRTTLMRMLNEERAARGMPKLRLDEAANQMASEHARRMARRGKIYHNPELKTAAGRKRLGNPVMIGENVGVGPSAKSVHRAFMKSRDHRANILRRGFRELGIAAYQDGKNLWVVQVFLRPPGRHVGTSYRAASPPSRSRRQAARPAAAVRPRPEAERAGSPALIGTWDETPRSFIDPAAALVGAAGSGAPSGPTAAPLIMVLATMALAVHSLARARRRRQPA